MKGRGLIEKLYQGLEDFDEFVEVDCLGEFSSCPQLLGEEESSDNESDSSQSSGGVEEDGGNNLRIDILSRMCCLDDPDTDYSDDSEGQEIEWRDAIVDGDDSVDFDRASSNSDMIMCDSPQIMSSNSDMVMCDSPEIMDALSDYSEHEENDELDDDDDDDDVEEEDEECDSPQAIEVDENSGDGMSSGEEEASSDYELDEDTDSEERDEEETVNERVVIRYNSDNFLDTSGSDSYSDSSRSRSPIYYPPSDLLPQPPTSRSRSPIYYPPSELPSQPPPTTGSTVANDLRVTPNNQPNKSAQLPAANQPVKKPVDKPSSSKTPTDVAENDGEGLCCICLDSVSTHVVVPCGHICLCQNCKDLFESKGNHTRKKHCPICKTPFSIIIKTYK